MKKQYRLKYVILAFMLIFVSAILSIVLIFNTFFLDDFYRYNKIKDMKNVANEIYDGIASNNFGRVFNNITMSNEVCVRIETGDTKLLGNKGNDVCALKYLSDDQVYNIYAETKLNNNEKVFDDYTLESETGPDDMYILSHVFNYQNNEILIMVSSIVVPINAVINTLNSNVIFIFIVFLLATLALGFFISKFFISPLHIINLEAKNLYHGEYDGDKIATKIKEFNDLNTTLIDSKHKINEAEKAKRELLSNVSHDLRTPLTMIAGYGEMMKDFEDERSDQNIDIIINEANRLNILVNDLLDLSKSELKELKMNPQEISLNKLLNDVYKQYSKYMESKNIEFIIELDKDVNVRLDESRIKQVLYNFINNAINYNNKTDAKVIISSKIENNEVIVNVYDNGEGISEDKLSLVWERYYKIDKEHRRSMMGSGIGLALSRSILESHNLEYGVNSKLNEYTNFYFKIKL